MKTPFRKSNRTFSERILKRNAQQKANGITGSEHSKDYLVDENGKAIEVGERKKGLMFVDDIPQILEQNFAVIADCGHKIASLQDVKGRCYRGHLICMNDQCSLYKCKECGAPLCDKEVVWVNENDPICPEHKLKVIISNISAGLLSLIIGAVTASFGRSKD